MRNLASRNKLLIVVAMVHAGSLLLLWWGNQPATMSYQTVQVPAEGEIVPQAISGNPAHIRVPSLGIDIPVARGVYDQPSATWTLSENSAYFAAPTAPVQDKAGNVLIYGHSNWQVFAILPDIARGAQAEVTTDNGHKFIYTYDSSTSVDPTDVSIFSYNGPPILTLQTCTGSWYQDRTLWRFKLTRVTEFVTPTEQQRRAAAATAIQYIGSQAAFKEIKNSLLAKKLQTVTNYDMPSQGDPTNLAVTNTHQLATDWISPVLATIRADSPIDRLLAYEQL